jgi:hypothetical protein
MNKNISKIKHKRLFMLFFMVYILTIISSSVFCTTTGLPVGAKYIALGGQVSVCDDVYSVYYNPASADFVAQQQVAAEYTGMMLGLPDSIGKSFLGYLFPTKKVGSFGFYWTNLAAGSLYSEHTFAFVYSKQKIILPRLSLGIRPKVYYISYGKPDGVYDNNGMWQSTTDSALENKSSKLSFGIDLGFVYQLAQNYAIGLQIENINQPNISLFDNSDVVIPTKFLLGITNINPKYGLNLDFGLKSSDILTSFGLQYKMLNDKLRLYSSIKLTIRSYTEKTVSLIEPSAGVEYVFDGFNIAYAFNLPLSGIDSFGNHTVSVSYKFGPVVKLPEDTSVLYAKIDKLEQQLREKEQEIEQLKKKLDELLSKPLPKEEEKLKKPEVKSKEKVVKPTVPTEEKPKEKVEEKKEMTPKQQYEELFNRYLSKKEEMTLVEQIKVVDTIIKQFKDKTDVSSAQKELNSLLKQQKAANDELQMSKSYYYKLKSAGTSPAELKVLLERIKKKYDGYGLDLKWIDEELQKLK